MNKMVFNVCDTCGACDGRAGFLVGTRGRMECRNCADTRRTGMFCVHIDLGRTDEELEKTGEILLSEKKSDIQTVVE